MRSSTFSSRTSHISPYGSARELSQQSAGHTESRPDRARLGRIDRPKAELEGFRLSEIRSGDALSTHDGAPHGGFLRRCLQIHAKQAGTWNALVVHAMRGSTWISAGLIAT